MSVASSANSIDYYYRNTTITLYTGIVLGVLLGLALIVAAPVAFVLSGLMLIVATPVLLLASL